MKVIVAGGRDFNDEDFMIESINSLIDTGVIPEPFTLICGMARGADLLAHSILSDNNFPIEEYPADWNKYGKRAGFIRNEQMGDIADAAIIFWDEVSRGTRHMKEYMQILGKPVYVFYYGDK